MTSDFVRLTQFEKLLTIVYDEFGEPHVVDEEIVERAEVPPTITATTVYP